MKKKYYSFYITVILLCIISQTYKSFCSKEPTNNKDPINLETNLPYTVNITFHVQYNDEIEQNFNNNQTDNTISIKHIMKRLIDKDTFLGGTLRHPVTWITLCLTILYLIYRKKINTYLKKSLSYIL